MKLIKYLFVGLVLSLAACMGSASDKAKNAVEEEKTSSLTINFDDESQGFSEKEKELISARAGKVEQELRELLSELPQKVELHFVKVDRDLRVVGGISGRAENPERIVIEISAIYPNGTIAAINKSLAGTLYHEFHHLNRGWTIEGNKFGPGIAIAVINEGLACIFSEEYTGDINEADIYPENVNEWALEILELSVNANYGHWMFDHPDGRQAIGYKTGRYIIHQALKNTGKSILELSEYSPDKIWELAKVK
ncbi:hypothetical protein GWK08_09180 [Leptobacterium flavescens]|uniref:DUF2268 domain-containing protein n=1 Tax=Leptobacterium flavescens TaxID=472055 RepID=A0A6P0UNW0_9FLAO|nr:DUF2268 domain-containing putative Zn-dependent protease [Leptobacterium flavescens]NER13608.1 hypothetical protein [Leptobacterium flavescens]